MEFKITPTKAPIDVPQIAAFKESVQEFARRIPDATELQIVQVAAGAYRVKQTDRYLVVNSNGGPVKIILPLPATKQELTVLKSNDSKNSITIVRVDAKPLGNVQGIFTVNGTESLLCDASQWWSL